MPVPLPPPIERRPRDSRVAGKVAIVTGGNAGIGSAPRSARVARCTAQRGVHRTV